MGAVTIGPEKKRYSSQASSRATPTSTRYAALVSTSFSSPSSLERPNATTQASKLMQTRLNVSGRTFWMIIAPRGTPTKMLGTIHGTSAKLAALYNPASEYAPAVSDDSARRTKPSAARKSFFVNPWLLSMTASGGPEIVVTEYRTPTPPPNTRPTDRSERIGPG